MCDKAVDKCHFVFDSLPDQHKTKEMWHKLVSEDYFKFQYCHGIINFFDVFAMKFIH